MSVMSRCVLLLFVLAAWSAAAESPAVPHVSVLEREVVVASAVVRVRLDLTIANPLLEEREHVLDLHVPESAAVDRFGMWVQGRYLEGEIAPRALGRRLYQEISGIDDPRRVKRDPALLTWKSPSLLRLRVFPVPAQGQVRLRLSYVVLRPLVGELVIPAAFSAAAARSSAIADTAQTIPALPPLADQMRAQAFSAKAGEPGYFLALLPVTAWAQQGPTLKTDLELVLRDTSRRMAGRYGPGSSLQRELASRLAAAHPVFLLDADVVPHPVVALDARSAGSEPSCGGLFDLAAALRAAEVFLAEHAGKQVRLTVLGDAEPECGAALSAAPVLPQVPGGQVRLVCTGSPSWLRALAPALIDDHAFTDVHLSGVDGVDELGPAWLARAVPSEHLLVFGRHHGERGTLRIRQRAPDGRMVEQSHTLAFQPDADATWLPRLWADARVRDLAHATGDPAVPAERERQQQEIARTHQVLAPASSFVVLSNERDYRANDLERAARMAGWAEVATTELVTEPANDAWQFHQNVGSRFMPPAPEPVGVDLSRVWQTMTSGLYIPEERIDGNAMLQRWGDGHWNGDRQIGELAVPPVAWAPRVSAIDADAITPAVRALWGERVAPMRCISDGQKWSWWREGERAVLVHLTADDVPDWWIVIDANGIRTARPDWGVWWRHPPMDGYLFNCLLELSPSPTWLPLSWLSQHFQIGSEKRDGATLVTLLQRSTENDRQRDERTRGYLFRTGTTLPVVQWHGGGAWGTNAVTYRREGDQVIAQSELGTVLSVTLFPAPVSNPHLPFADDQTTVGVLDAAPIWQRVRTGTATAGDCWQMALAAAIPAEALPWLERAHAIKPDDAGIALHLAAVLRSCGYAQRARELLSVIDGMVLPAWQRRGFTNLRHQLDDPSPTTDTVDDARTPTAIPTTESWPTPWNGNGSELASATDFTAQVQAAVTAVQPEQLADLARQSRWGGLKYLTLPGSRKVMDVVFGSATEPAQWSPAAAEELIRHLEGDGIGRQVITQSLTNIPFIATYLMQALRDPTRVELARAALRPSYEDWCDQDERLRQRLLALGDAPYPPTVQVLAQARMLGNFLWSVSDRAATDAGMRVRLAAIPQAEIRLCLIGDCLDIMEYLNDDRPPEWGGRPATVDHQSVSGLFDSAAGMWDLIVATRAAIQDPALYAPAQVDLERALARVLLAVIVTHRPADLAAVLDRIQRLPREGTVQPAFGMLRPLAIQLCRQAAAVGLRQEAVTAATAIFSAAPEPGLLAALEQAPDRELALIPSSYAIAIDSTYDSSAAPEGWWPEWREDADTLVERCRTHGDQPPDDRVLYAVQQRRLGREVARAAIVAFPEHGPDLRWAALKSPRDPLSVRQALQSLRTIRQTIQIPTYGVMDGMQLALLNGLLPEALQEFAIIRSTAPGDRRLFAIQLALMSLDGDEKALEVARGWVATIAPQDGLGREYARIVDILTTVRRYQDAFTMRQEALAAFERLRAGPMPPDATDYDWSWLSAQESAGSGLFDNVVVAPDTTLFPDAAADPAPQAEVELMALGRYPVIAAKATSGFDTASQVQRFAWFSALWRADTKRLGAECVPLVEWLRQQVADRAPLPDDICEAVLTLVRPESATVWIDYARQAKARSADKVASDLLRQASNRVTLTREADALMAIADLQGQPMPDHESWIWRVQNAPAGFNERLADIAVERVRWSLAGTDKDNHRGSDNDDRTWVQQHPEVKLRIDQLVDAIVAEHPDDAVLLARCAVLGGTQSAEAIWRRLASNPPATVRVSSDHQLSERVREGCIRSLLQDGRWAELADLLRIYRRARATSWPRETLYENKVPDAAVAAGAVDAASACAALLGNAPWLMAHGFPDPTTHADWSPDDHRIWRLRGDPPRLLAAAEAVLEDPFSSQDSRTNAHTWRFAVHLWHGEHRQAAAALDDLVADNPHGLADNDPSTCMHRTIRDAESGIDSFWSEAGQRLCSDWSTTHPAQDDSEEEHGEHRRNFFALRRHEFLAYCANAPMAELSPFTLLMGLSALREQQPQVDPALLHNVILDMATVAGRCRDLGLHEQVRDWISHGGELPFPVVPSAANWPALMVLYGIHSEMVGRPSFPTWGGDEVEPWQLVPRGQQVDILRRLSELTEMPRAEGWWPEIREWSEYESVVQDLLPAQEPLTDPAEPPEAVATSLIPAGTIPPPAVWLAREAWRRAPPTSAFQNSIR